MLRTLMIVLSALTLLSCGIKGDPLPPESAMKTPSPTPSPTPKPTAKAVKPAAKSKKGR